MHKPIYPVDTVKQIAKKHGFGSHEIFPMERHGVVNDVWALGNEAVLRIPLGNEEERDALTEAVAVPVALNHGVLTPDLLAVDLDRDIVPFAFTIYRRAKGVTLGTMPYGPQWDECYEQLGQQQRLIADIPSVDDPNLWLDRQEEVDVEEELRGARPNWSPEEEARWREWFEFLGEADPVIDKSFVHWDLHPWNILADPVTHNLTAILDWGDAGFHDPAVDFGHAILSTVAPQMRGFARYHDGEFGKAILQHALIWMLCEVQDLDFRFRRDWWCYPKGGMLEASQLALNNKDLAPWVPDLR